MLVKDLRSRGLKSRSDSLGVAIDLRLSRRVVRCGGEEPTRIGPRVNTFRELFRRFFPGSRKDGGSTGENSPHGTAGGRERRMEQEEREGMEGRLEAVKCGGWVETASRGRGKAGFRTANGREIREEQPEEPRRARNTRKGEGGGTGESMDTMNVVVGMRRRRDDSPALFILAGKTAFRKGPARVGQTTRLIVCHAVFHGGKPAARAARGIGRLPRSKGGCHPCVPKGPKALQS